MDTATESPSVRPGHASQPLPARVALFTGAYNHIADGVSLTLNRLVDHLERHVCLQASGGYQRPVARFLHEEGLTARGRQSPAHKLLR